MKVDKVIIKKFCETEKGKKLYIGNIIACVLYILSLASIIYIFVNEGKIITSLISSLALFSALFAMSASFLVATYYISLQQFADNHKK